MSADKTILRSASSDMRSMSRYAFDRLVPPQNTKVAPGMGRLNNARSAVVRCSSFSRRPGVISGYRGSYSATRASISSFCSEESDLMPTQTSRFCH
ncbi:hypothetical protein H206_05651 [Candidatus Electrothrix aarhusensis]|uniref:Uncharacterized protein n=1 Tax=Candidatus Electrothrix aarhusensis TaxID=1859131 RepID=A0A3S3QU25_9BACT|nr:hypothetical protein H206_05651 [Candidatus Electrothrix aarhusensis]